MIGSLPKLGMMIPEMGSIQTEALPGGVAGALFTPVQRRVLGLLFGQPERLFGSGELIRAAASGTGAVHRQLQRLEKVGLVAVTRIGNQKHYQANRQSPIFHELRGLVVKTIGLVEPLRRALQPIADRMELAFIFGSIAKGTERAGSDVDLLVVSDDLSYAEVYEALQPAEKTLARPINPTVWTRMEWRKEVAKRDSFASRIAGQERLFLIGSDHAET